MGLQILWFYKKEEANTEVFIQSSEARIASQTLHLFLHAILVVAVRQVEANGIGEVEVDLLDEAMPFPQLAQGLLLLVLSWQGERTWQGGNPFDCSTSLAHVFGK